MTIHRLFSASIFSDRRLLISSAIVAGGFFASKILGLLREILIARTFGVHYHPAHVWKVLRGEHWSCQKPERQARERDDAAIERWRTERWPHIKKRPAGRS